IEGCPKSLMPKGDFTVRWCGGRPVPVDVCSPAAYQAPIRWPRSSMFPAEMHEHAAEVPRILLDPVVERLDVLLLQVAEYSLLQLTGALARDDLHEFCLARYRFGDDVLQRALDVAGPVVDVVQIKFELHPEPPIRHSVRSSSATDQA